MKSAITISNLSKYYKPNITALDNVSMSITPGEFFFLLGPSGCGKTTLLRTISGFVEPDAGKILLNEIDITKLSPEKRGIAMVFQNYALWPHLTIFENIAFGLEVAGVAKAEKIRRVNEILEIIQLAGFEKRFPAELSGGQQQRVALARALVVKPSCLLLDEPLSNLDANLRIAMRMEIRRLCKIANVTAICVTHDQKEALAMADKIAVMKNGGIEQIDTPFNLYKKPKNEFVANFMGEMTIFNGKNVRPETLFFSEGGQDKITAIEYQGATVVYSISHLNEMVRISIHNPIKLFSVGDFVTILNIGE